MSSRESMVAQRYAGALIQGAADRDGALEAARALDGLAAAAGDAGFVRLAGDSRVRPEDRLGVLMDVAAAIKAPERVRRFLEVVGRGRRLGALGAIATRYRAMVDERFGSRRATLRIPFAPSAGLLAEIKARLEARLGGKVEVEVVVDPALVGGFEVRCGDQLIKADVESRLKALAATLLDDLDEPRAPPANSK